MLYVLNGNVVSYKGLTLTIVSFNNNNIKAIVVVGTPMPVPTFTPISSFKT